MACLSVGSLRAAAFVAVGLAALSVPLPALARGPESVADVAEPLLDAVVNIATSQNIASVRDSTPAPKLPEGSPFQHFFDEFAQLAPALADHADHHHISRHAARQRG